MTLRRGMLMLLLLALTAWQAQAQDEPERNYTPLRLSYLEGSVSFWRPGAPDWVNAQVNTPLAPGDALYGGEGANLELQFDSRAFVRADENTQLSVSDQTHGFLQIMITAGRVSFDLRELRADYLLEVDTPNAVFTIRNPGYYRVEVGSETHFITRRGGVATVMAIGGEAQSVLPSEQVVVRDGPTVTTYVAPQPDQWDQWNTTRSEDLIDSLSSRYVPPGVAGIDDLDHYGSWRVVPDYGAVWVPDITTPDWAPYSTGSWVWDPYFQWTWVDDSSWGWAPYHYGRWVYIDGVWAWAPGPIVAHRPAYAPALVSFFAIDQDAARHLGGLGMSWVALGWGEPLHPWWGRPEFRGKPTWRGWGGPHGEPPAGAGAVHNRNAVVANAIVYAPDAGFSRGHGHAAYRHLNRSELGGHELNPLLGELPVKVTRESRIGSAPATHIRPPDALFNRPVPSAQPPIATRPPGLHEAMENKPAVVVPPRPWTELPRPQFGGQDGAERFRPATSPRFREARPPAPVVPAPGLIQPGGSPPAPARALPPEVRTPVPAREATLPMHHESVSPRERPAFRPHTEPRGEPFTPSARAKEPPVRTEEHREEAAHLPGRPANQTYHQPGQERGH
jgi:hypothetical protein